MCVVSSPNVVYVAALPCKNVTTALFVFNVHCFKGFFFVLQNLVHFHPNFVLCSIMESAQWLQLASHCALTDICNCTLTTKIPKMQTNCLFFADLCVSGWSVLCVVFCPEVFAYHMKW